jgi:hypothetical protein
MFALLRRAARGVPIVCVAGALAPLNGLGAQGTHSRPLATQLPAAPPAFAVDALHSPGRDVTISLLTVGVGNEVWQMFGHSAIWIHDNLTRRDTVFNWGVFDMTAPHFIPHFLEGLMLYSIGGETLDRVLYENRYFNRAIWSQELDLTAPQKDSLLHMIARNSEPEHAKYRYDYFEDNCATRPRDLLDAVLGGRIRATSSQLTPWTYRTEALRLMQGDKPLVTGVDMALGEPSDHALSEWQEMFLPRRLHDFLATLEVSDSTGAMHPLVRQEAVLYQSTRPPAATMVPPLGIWLLAVGVIAALVLAVLGTVASADGGGARVAAAVAACVWCVAAGLLGVILALLWGVTDHVFAHANENLLLFNPLWLLLAVLAPVYLVTGRAGRWTRGTAKTLALLALVALAAHVVDLSRQNNLALIALGLPPALAIVWVVRRRRPAVTPAA